jgi:UDP-glucose 4-epimerase
MPKKRVILVTGVGSYWGAQVATRLITEFDLRSMSGGQLEERLTAENNYHVIGLDLEPPEQEINGLDFIQADIRNPLLVELIKSEQVDTVCHMVLGETVRSNEASFDLNVIGTMKVLGACSEAGVRKVVLKSSTGVYGALPTNPAFITEQHPLSGNRASGTTRDLAEIEAFCNGFRRQFQEMILTTLLFANII